MNTTASRTTRHPIRHGRLLPALGVMVFAALLFSTQAGAGLYKYRDENGTVVYSQTPPESGEYEYMQTPRTAGSGRAAPSRPAPTPGASAGGGNALTDPAAADDPTVQAELARAQQLKKENCERAKKNLEVFTVYRRIKNEDGEVVYVDDNVRQQRIEEAKAAIKEFCN